MKLCENEFVWGNLCQLIITLRIQKQLVRHTVYVAESILFIIIARNCGHRFVIQPSDKNFLSAKYMKFLNRSSTNEPYSPTKTEFADSFSINMYKNISNSKRNVHDIQHFVPVYYNKLNVHPERKYRSCKPRY